MANVMCTERAHLPKNARDVLDELRGGAPHRRPTSASGVLDRNFLDDVQLNIDVLREPAPNVLNDMPLVPNWGTTYMRTSPEAAAPRTPTPHRALRPASPERTRIDAVDIVDAATALVGMKLKFWHFRHSKLH